jgi:flagellar basal-body rod protein FlgF
LVRGMYSATSGALVAQSAVDTIANNLANVNTVGFKRTLLQVQAQPKTQLYRFQTDPARASGGQPAQVPIGSLGSGAQVYDTPADFSQGAIATTGNDLDVALSGPGFFAIRGGNGVLRYSRDGQFVRDQNGMLTAQNGDQVLSASGAPIALPPQGKIVIDRTGAINIDGQNYGKLGLVEFTNASALRPEGSSRFADTGNAGARTATNTTALQGSVEKSNADVIRSMVDLIANERWFEANQKSIQTQDTAVAQAVQTVGRSNA